ncbi:MAG: hypothetical protein K8E24_005100 [Methanobacterium paludis]|nr:hypothetical protein [Methanobacterium paludis]
MEELVQYYTNSVQLTTDSQGFPYPCSTVEEFSRIHEPSLSFAGMTYSKKKEGLDKLPLIKDDKVKEWLNSDEFIVDILSTITHRIGESAKDFDLEIEDIYIEDAYPNEDEPLEEFVIKVKVSEGTDIYEINKFWNFIGSKITEFLDGNFDNNQDKIDEIDEKILIIVAEDDNV